MESSLRQLDQGLWVIDYPEHMAVGLRLGTRTTLVETEAGLWVHSPGPPGQHLQNFPAPFAFVAPNSMHHLYFAQAHERYPQARGWAPAELLVKRPDLRAERLSGPQTSAIDCLALGGLGGLGEWVFLHRASRTLIVTDLVFHLLESPDFWTRLVMRLNGVYGKLGPSRIFRRLMVKNQAELALSMRQMLEWDFDRVVMAHGEVLETGGKEAIRRAFAWLPL